MTHFDILSYIQELPQKNTDGNGDPLVALAELRTISKAIEAATKVVDQEALREAEKYPKEFERAGYKFTKSDGRAMYSYDHILDWMETKAHLRGIEERAKTAANVAKGSMVVTKDGEIHEAAIITYTKASLSVK